MIDASQKLNGLLFIVAVFIAACTTKPSENPEPVRDYLSWNHLINAEHLKERQDNAHLKIVDLRSVKDFDYGHIPRAIHISMLGLEDTNAPIAGIMATKKQMEQLLGECGIESTDTLVAYDDNSGVNAARLWWILKVYGFNNVMLLNGGSRAWRMAKGDWSKKAESFSPTLFSFPAKGDSSVLATLNDIRPILYQGEVALLDSRIMDEYNGHVNAVGAAYRGHIQSSRNFIWTNFIHLNGDRKIKSVVELDTVLMAGMLQLNQDIIVYSNTGKSSAFTTFVLTELAGCTSVKNYDGGWAEWSHLNKEIEPNLK